MQLAIDIGNTTVRCAVISGSKVIPLDVLETKTKEGILFGKIKRVIHKTVKGYSVDEATVCSVVSRVLALFKRAGAELHFPVRVIGKDVAVPMVNKYADPAQVGQDRLVCAYAAWELYGAPSVVVDLGTAITFDVVSSKGEYLGGIIAPGIRLSVETLFNQTALLPKVKVARPKRVIGKSTDESILSGIFYGYGEMINGLIKLLKKQVHADPVIVVTGGYAELMKSYIPEHKCIIDKDLVFKGIGFASSRR